MIQVISSDKEKLLSLIPQEQISPEFNFDDKWIHLSNPTDKEIEFVSSSCAVPEEMIKAALDEEERARGERTTIYRLSFATYPSSKKTTTIILIPQCRSA